MDLRTLNLDDAKTGETFGGEALKSGAGAVQIIRCEKATTQNGATTLNFELKVNNTTRYTTMWLTSNNDGAIVENEYESKRLKQLLILLKIEPSTLTEVPTDKEWVKLIPQIVGTVGAVYEVVPVGTKYNKTEYPKFVIVSFFILSTMQTLKEYTNNQKAEIVEKEVAKLLEKKYTPHNNGNGQRPPANSQKFDASGTLSESDMPF